MFRTIAGWSFTQAASLVFSAPSMTVATSRYAHRRAIAVGDDDGPVLLAGLKLIVIVDGPGLVRSVEVTLGLIHVGAAQRRPQRLQAQAVRGQRSRVGLHAHGGALAAADAHQAHALELRNSLRHARFGQFLHFGQRQGLEVMASVRIGASAGFVLL